MCVRINVRIHDCVCVNAFVYMCEFTFAQDRVRVSTPWFMQEIYKFYICVCFTCVYCFM